MTTEVILPGEVAYVVIPDDTLGTLLFTPTGDEVAYVIADDELTTIFIGTEGPTGAAGLNARVDFAFGWQGLLFDAENLPGVSVVGPVTFTSVDSYGYARTAATADATLQLMNKGTQIGTVVFPAGLNVPVVTLTGGQYAAVRGDFIYAIAPSPPDQSLADGGFTLASA